MKEYLADLVRAAPSPLLARNLGREYLQARILGAMTSLAFHGGTALRCQRRANHFSPQCKSVIM